MNKRTQMSQLSLEKRISSFEEVLKGYTLEEAIEEASRCLNCKTKPCVSGCPVNIDIPNFIQSIKENDINKAYNTITTQNSLPGVCGRVCPQETQCESKCVRGIKGESVAIGKLERFVADNVDDIKLIIENDNNKNKIAIVGSGPAGLACASVLIKNGFEVTVYEAMHKFGGVLTYGIPEFRLPKAVVKKEILNLEKLGVKFINNVVIGKTLLIEDIFEDDYKAIFVATGAGLPKFMNIEGENLNGVLSANEFLTRINLMKAYLDEYDTPLKKTKVVSVVGGGNVAMDAARCARRLNNDVYLIYRRTVNEMPARKEEVEHAIEEGIKVLELSNPEKICSDDFGNVESLICRKMILGEPDASGRRTPIPSDETFILKTDEVIMALGNYPNPLLSNAEKNLAIDRRGCLIINEKCETSIKNVFAGGDATTGAATVILAMEAGKKAAKSIINLFK